MKRLLAGVGVLTAAAAVGVFAIFLLPRNGGPLDEVGNGFGGPVQAGHPFTANYLLYNNGDRSIEVSKVALGDHSPGLRLLGARVQTSGTHFGGAWAGFPLERTTSVPVESYVLAPHRYAPLQVGLEADTLGNYRLLGVEVEYQVPFLGRVRRRYTRTVTTRMAVCAQHNPVRAKTHLCRAPSIG